MIKSTVAMFHAVDQTGRPSYAWIFRAVELQSMLTPTVIGHRSVRKTMRKKDVDPQTVCVAVLEQSARQRGTGIMHP